MVSLWNSHGVWPAFRPCSTSGSSYRESDDVTEADSQQQNVDHGSGLLAGDGLVWGTWIPLSMIGYAMGAKLAN